jgi:predicted regulator of Ras-like GTPase activity (Roadblock/LC7/MglB family)
MAQEVEAAFAEMLDISTDIDRAALIGSAGILVSNMAEEAQEVAVVQARELARLGEARAAEMGSQPFTQLVVETPSGYVFYARELAADGMAMLATGKKGSRVGLVLYDLRTCMRDAREAMSAKASDDADTREE